MVTKNPRINITFDKPVVSLLSKLAEHEHKSLSGLVRELTLEALELREDFQLSKIAEALDKKHAKTVNHDDAWK